MLSKTQVDKLGERLKLPTNTENDRIFLAEYKKSYTKAYQFVDKKLREIGLDSTGRFNYSKITKRKLSFDSNSGYCWS